MKGNFFEILVNNILLLIMVNSKKRRRGHESVEDEVDNHIFKFMHVYFISFMYDMYFISIVYDVDS